MRRVQGIVEQEKQEDQGKSASLLETELPLQLGVHPAEHLSAVEAQDEETCDREEGSEAELKGGILGVNPRHVEVDRCVVEFGEHIRRFHLDGHVIHFVVNLGNEADGEVGAQLACTIARKANLLIRLIRVQVVPFFLVSIFGAHLHAVLNVEVEPLIRGTLSGDEAVDEDLLVDGEHASDAAVPDWSTLILVEGTALHGVVEHVFELDVRDWVQLPRLTLVVTLLILVIPGESVFHRVNWAGVDIAFVVDEHVNGQGRDE